MEKLKEILLKFFKLDSIVEHVNGYLESRVALIKLEIREEIASVLSRAIIILIMFLIGFLFIVFLSIGVAQFLNTWLGSDYEGFMYVSGVYGLVLLSVIVFRKGLLKTFEKKFEGVIRQKDN